MPGSCICSGLPVANCLRQLCPLGTRSLSAQASVCGSRTVGCPEFIRGIQFRPLGRNSLTTFRGQTALRGCPRARGVRCRIAPCRSLCSPPTLPAGRFGLRPRPHWGHASLRDSSLRSPAGKKAFIAHFGGGARNVARDGVGQLSPAFGARSCSPFSAVKMGGPFSLRCLSPLCSPAVGVGQAYPLRGGMLRCDLAVLQRQVMRVSVPAQSAVGRLTHCRAGWFIMLDCFAAQSNEGFCSLAVGVGHTQPLQGFCFRRSGWRSVLPLAGDFGMPSTSGFGGASHEARRRMAV